MRNYRDFVFARMSAKGPDFEEFFGDSLSSLDNMIDRSPVGKLEVAGGVLRYMHTCNWKMLVDNQTDTCHPMVAHESSAGTAREVWKPYEGTGAKKPMAVEIFLPFVSPYEFFEGMGIRVWDNGHGHTGVALDPLGLFGGAGLFREDGRGLRRGARQGDPRREPPQHGLFPQHHDQGADPALRNFIPLAADKTLVESWTFRLVDAPDMLLERTLMYNRLINAPTSVVGHDDLEMYERAQEGLHANGNEWVNVQRLYDASEVGQASAVTNGTNEWQMRNQFRAWSKFMTMSM